MSNTISSPNMSLPVPVVGVDPGPDWADDLNSCLTLIDQHDHSSGNGVQITPSGLNISSDLTIGGNNLTNIKSTRFSAQGSPLAGASDLGCAYVSGVDLYYNDVNGNQIRLTQSGSIVGTSGSISGLVSPASASYSAGSATFVWQSGVNTAANLDARNVLLRNATASSNALTLSPPLAMGSNFTVTLPSIPGSQSFLSIDTSGNITGYAAVANGITGSMIAAATVANANMAANSVGTTQIIDAAVTTAKIADGSVTPAKLSSSVTITGTKAWCNFKANTTGKTYAQSGTTATVTWTSHGASSGWYMYLNFTTGSGTDNDGWYQITVVDANTFTAVVPNSHSTSGNVTPEVIMRAGYNISTTSGIVKTGVGTFTINFQTAMTDAWYSFAGVASNNANLLVIQPNGAVSTNMTTTSFKIRVYETASVTAVEPTDCVLISVNGN